MTCREFKHSAASLTLWEMSQRPNDEILSHADGCESCGAWLRKQRSLAASMRTLQAETAALEAGPGVEQALLAAFRRSSGDEHRFCARWAGAPLCIFAVKSGRQFYSDGDAA